MGVTQHYTRPPPLVLIVARLKHHDTTQHDPDHRAG
jgi:hypothetical protein